MPKTKPVKAAVQSAVPAKLHRGFRAMDPKKQRKIAASGGRTVVGKYGSKHMARLGAIGGANSHKSTNAKGNGQ